MGETRHATRRTDRAVSKVRATSTENIGYQSTQGAGGNVWKYERGRDRMTEQNYSNKLMDGLCSSPNVMRVRKYNTRQ